MLIAIRVSVIVNLSNISKPESKDTLTFDIVFLLDLAFKFILDLARQTLSIITIQFLITLG
jgi:hypothetical protein